MTRFRPRSPRSLTARFPDRGPALTSGSEGHCHGLTTSPDLKPRPDINADGCSDVVGRSDDRQQLHDLPATADDAAEESKSARSARHQSIHAAARAIRAGRAADEVEQPAANVDFDRA